MKRVLLTLVLMVCSRGAAAQCYTVGSTFAEDPGNVVSSPYPCWSGGPSSCAQTWQVIQGSGQSIATAPGGGWNCSNVVKFPAGATPLELASYGTLPNIPSGATSDISAEFYYDNTTINAFNLLLNLTFPGSGTPAVGFGFWTSGSSQCAINGGAVIVTCSINTRHLIHIHLQGASSSFQIDGGSSTVFSGAATNWFEIQLFGDSTANVYWGNVYINYGSAGWCVPPPMAISDWAGGSGAANAAQMNSGTHGVNNNAVTGWVPDAFSNVSYAYSAGGSPFNLPRSVCGAAYSGNTNVELGMVLPVSASAAGGWRTTYYTSFSNVSIGFLFSYNESGQNAAIDFFDFDLANTEQFANCGPNQCMCFENNSSGMANCSAAPIAQNTPYWITVNNTSSGNDTMKIYTYPGLSLVDTITSNGSDNVFAPGLLVILLGKAGSQPVNNSCNVLYANMLLDLSGTFPLLPPSSAGSSPSPVPFWLTERIDSMPNLLAKRGS